MKRKLKAGDTVRILKAANEGKELVVRCVHDTPNGATFFLIGGGNGNTCPEHTYLGGEGSYQMGPGGLNEPGSWELVNSAKSPAKKDKLSEDHLQKLILPPEDIRLIESVLRQRENHSKIFKTWGLEDTVEYGKGMGFLFHGTPGTGKTFAALCIARSMGQELHSIGPAEIQTQEPGGANRAIQEAFRIATKQKKVLLLDECDGLIADRSNLGMILGGEVNTLLTEIEKFEGVVILATNRINHLDPALERRLSLILEFKVPTPENRLRIWKGIIPKKMPVKGTTAELLAAVPLTGGQIKNVLLSAARIAAATKSKAVTKEHFDEATYMILKSKNLMGKQRNIGSSRSYPTNN